MNATGSNTALDSQLMLGADNGVSSKTAQTVSFFALFAQKLHSFSDRLR